MWQWGWMLLHAIELDGLVIVQNGFPRLPEIVVAKAEIFIRPHYPRIKRNDLMEFGDRLRVVLGVIIQSSEPIDIAGVLWGTIYEFFEFTPRPIAPAQTNIRHRQSKSSLAIHRHNRIRLFPGNRRIQILAIQEKQMASQGIDLRCLQ